MGESKQDFIGFPPPLLGERPLRLAVLHHGDGLLALDKPSGISAAPHPWYLDMPHLDVAINEQVQAGKPELERLGIEGVHAVFHCEPYYSGVMLFATDSDSAEYYRNQYGSALMELTLQLICKPSEGDSERQCELPLAQHWGIQQRMVVSSATGKKAQTAFRELERIGSYALWEATLRYHRLHQILIHASEVGLPIVGDGIYAREQELLLSRIKRGYRLDGSGEERPIYDGPIIRLSQLKLTTQAGSELVIDAGPEKRLEGVLKRLRQFAR